MRKLATILVVSFLFSFCGTKKIDRCTAIVRTSAGGFKTTWMYDRRKKYDFKSSVKWCKGLGGKLPIIHTKEDFDLIQKIVFVTDYPGRRAGTWMGRNSVSLTSQCSREWLDGSPIQYSFNYSKTNSAYGFPEKIKETEDSCIECEHDDCCAMFLPSYERVRGTVAFASCETNMSRICVIPGEFMSRSDNPYNETGCLHIQGPVKAEDLKDSSSSIAPFNNFRFYETMYTFLNSTSTIASYTATNTVVNILHLITIIGVVCYVAYKVHIKRNSKSVGRLSTITLNDLL